MAANAMARETLFALRQTIARIEGRASTGLIATAEDPSRVGLGAPVTGNAGEAVLPVGPMELDALMEGGLPLDALTEIRSAQLRDAGAASGFVLALSVRLLARKATVSGPARVLWIGERVAAMEAGLPHAAGLMDYGLEPHHLLYATPRRLEDGLWLAEAGLGSGAFAAVILEINGNPRRFGLTESRRLSLKARSAGRPLLLLRQGGEEEAGSAFFRFCVRPAPAQGYLLPDGTELGRSIGNPAFHVTLEKSRLPAPADIHLEWNAHDRLFFLARPDALSAGKPADFGAGFPASADRPDRAPPMGTVLAFSRAS